MPPADEVGGEGGAGRPDEQLAGVGHASPDDDAAGVEDRADGRQPPTEVGPEVVEQLDARDVALAGEVGDVTTLADSSVMNLIKDGMAKPSGD